MLLRYCFSILCVTVALVVTFFLFSIAHQMYFMLFIVAVVISSLYGGSGAGFFSIVLSLLCICYFFLEPFNSFMIRKFDDRLVFVTFSGVLLLVWWLSSHLKDLNDRLEIRVHEKTLQLERAYHQSQENEKRLRLRSKKFNIFGILFLDPKGMILFCNDGIEQIFEYPKDDLIGKHFSIFFTSEDVQKDRPQQELNALIENGCSADEVSYIRKDSTRFRAQVFNSCLKNNVEEIEGFAKIVRELKKPV